MPGLAIPAAVALLAGVLCSGAWPRAHALPAMLVLAAIGGLAMAAVARNALAVAAAVVAVAWAGGWWLGLRAHDRAIHSPARALLEPHLRPGGDGESVWIEARLREDAARSADGVSLYLDIARVRVGGAWTSTSGGLRLGLFGQVPVEASAAWRRGRCLRAPALLRVPGSFRNPGGHDAALDLARRGITLVGSVKSALLVEPCGDGTWLQERAGDLRERIRSAIGRHVGAHSPLSAAIVAAIVIGDRAAIGEEVEERLRRAGTYHVIAISGGNIAILTGLLIWLAAWSRAPPRLASLLALCVLAAYAGTVVRGASVDRAVLVAMVYLVARAADLRAHPLALLATTASVLLVWDPLTAFDVGFALTFGATAGLILAVPPLMAWWSGAVAERVAPRPLSLALEAAFAPLAATLAAEIAVLPIAASVFGRVTFAGLLLNFVAVPMMACVQVAGLLTVVLTHLAPAAADLAGGVAHFAVRGLTDSAHLADWWPWLLRVTPPPSSWLLLAHGLAVTLACAPPVPDRVRHAAGAATLASCCAIAYGWWPEKGTTFARPLGDRHQDARALRVTVLDVGQGDAVVVQFPRGQTMLVDTGGLAASPRFDIGRRVVAPALHALGARGLTWLVLTHGDPDHIGGAGALIDDWRPREVWDGVPVARHEPTLALRTLADRHGIPWRTLVTGDHVRVDEVEVHARHPDPPDWERQRVRNDDSVVLELRYRSVSIVLPGDIGAAVEQRLAARPWPPRLRVLKAAHHGSAGSSSREWLLALEPAAVVYSAGRGNPFGHPAKAALDGASRVGADAFRTDEDGAVHIATDGERLAIETMSGRRWMRRAR